MWNTLLWNKREYHITYCKTTYETISSCCFECWLDQISNWRGAWKKSPKWLDKLLLDSPSNLPSNSFWNTSSVWHYFDSHLFVSWFWEGRLCMSLVWISKILCCCFRQSSHSVMISMQVMSFTVILSVFMSLFQCCVTCQNLSLQGFIRDLINLTRLNLDEPTS